MRTLHAAPFFYSCHSTLSEVEGEESAVLSIGTSQSAATARTQKTKASRMGRLIHKNQTSFLPTHKILHRQLTHIGGNLLLKSRPIPNPHTRTNQSLAFR